MMLRIVQNDALGNTTNLASTLNNVVARELTIARLRQRNGHINERQVLNDIKPQDFASLDYRCKMDLQ